MQRLNLTLNDEVASMLNKLTKDLNMSKTQVISNALEDMYEKKRIEHRQALGIKSFKAFKDDEEFHKEQLELAEAGVGDGII
ncbi:hypothetical protein [Campylobacter lari]|uniref:hypothetical protein n=1 Tax=Campylobacter lari TaxID=201 RepID=UPI0037292072